jgi:hypothetical protein
MLKLVLLAKIGLSELTRAKMAAGAFSHVRVHRPCFEYRLEFKSRRADLWVVLRLDRRSALQADDAKCSQ